MYFNQIPPLVIDFLIEFHSCLRGVHFFDIARFPTIAPLNLIVDSDGHLSDAVASGDVGRQAGR